MGCGVTQFMADNNIEMQDNILEDVSIDFKGAGIFAKHISLKEGQCVIKHKHAYPHLSLLLEGSVIVETDEGLYSLDAPTSMIIQAGLHHKLIALTDALWLCIHAENA